MTETIYGTKLNYNVAGEGDAILLLHGWGGSTDSFKGVADAFCHKQKIINLDFPPFGASGAPDRVWGVTDYVNLVLELLNRLKIDRVTIIAHSFGGRVAIYLAANYPERIDRLVLVDSAGLRPKRTWRYYINIRRYKRAKRRGEDVSGYGSEDYKKLSADMKQTFTKIVNEDLGKYLTRIKAETLIIWGRKDTDTPMYMARKLKKKITNSALVTIEGGHYAYAERYRQFLKILEAFFKG